VRSSSFLVLDTSGRDPRPNCSSYTLSMALASQLLDILACPSDKGPLLYFEAENSLYNPRLRLRYSIVDDIPIMLIDKAETLDDAEHNTLVALADERGIAPTFEA
jgi:uncharacterized protein YbaR (Trm112 family)